MLKLNVGFTKKVGEANYGSRGAAVNLELELDSTLVGDTDRLKERIRHLFGLAKASVDEELAAGGQPGTNGNSEPMVTRERPIRRVARTRTAAVGTARAGPPRAKSER